jgi:hypothetical protein
VLDQLHQERQRLDEIIEGLQHLQTAEMPNRRVRKGMGSAGRKAASQRMKRYWAARKEESTKPQENLASGQ